MESVALTARGLRLRHLSDEAVLDRTLSGDSIAFGELHRRFRRRIEGFCAARVSALVTADDAAQETFLRVLRASPQTIRNAEAWLFTVARNTCNDLMRRTQHLDEYADDVEDFSFDELPVADTATELMRRQTARSVFLALRRLPARYRSAIILREFHGMSSAEIAESMGVSQGAVDPIVSRARDAFGVAYAEVSGFPDACRTAVEFIYRDLGSGIEPREHAALDAHVKACPRCSAELRRANSPRYQHALAPLITLAAPKLGLFGEALRQAVITPGLLETTTHAATVPSILVAAAVGTAVVVGAIGLGTAPAPRYRDDLDKLVRSGISATATMPGHGDSEDTREQGGTYGGETADGIQTRASAGTFGGTPTGSGSYTSGPSGTGSSGSGTGSGSGSGSHTNAQSGPSSGDAESSGGGTGSTGSPSGSGGTSTGGSTTGGTGSGDYGSGGGTQSGGTSGTGSGIGSDAGSATGGGTGTGTGQQPSSGGTGGAAGH